MSNPYSSSAPVAYDTPRSGCLTAFLVLMLIVNPLVSLLYLTMMAAGPATGSPSAPVLLLLAVLGLVNTAGAVAIWLRMKVGMYMVVAVAVIALVVNLATGNYAGATGLLGPVLLGYLVSQEWHAYT